MKRWTEKLTLLLQCTVVNFFRVQHVLWETFTPHDSGQNPLSSVAPSLWTLFAARKVATVHDIVPRAAEKSLRVWLGLLKVLVRAAPSLLAMRVTQLRGITMLSLRMMKILFAVRVVLQPWSGFGLEPAPQQHETPSREVHPRYILL